MDLIGNFLSRFSTLPYLLPALTIGLVVHEWAHAWVAYRLGDSTPYEEGRVTLNPLRHIDPLGLIMMIFIGIGWARPVPVNRSRFQHPIMGDLMTTLAGPMSNFLLAIIGACILIKGGLDPASIPYKFLEIFFYGNIMLFIFNLLPFPPLDGYRIIEAFLPRSVQNALAPFTLMGSIFLMIFLLIPAARNQLTGLVEYTGNAIINSVYRWFDTG